jgi:RNA polymerase sigma factor (sigma-70 family)
LTKPSKDVVSGVFEQLLSARVALLPETEEGYLLTAVRNSCIKRIKHQDARQRMEKLYRSEQSLTLSSPERDEARLDALMAFARRNLTPQEQHIFEMRFIAGKSYQDIAADQGISKVAVWKHLSHLVTTMKEHFKNADL